ncbi:hypothetical protein [Brevundimonas diminuta]|uniref:hypothetical protein n=1 Tax=Brevundimonas diminuta TaxID=293 RepID=UPI003D01FA77
MITASLNSTAARIIRALRSRSNLRPAALFCLGATIAVFGMLLGMSRTSPTSFAVMLMIAGVLLGAFAIAEVLLRPDAANDN